MGQDKIHICAEPDALVQLGLNQNFREGLYLKQIIKNKSEICLIMDEDEFCTQWNNSESNLRKFFDSYDLAKIIKVTPSVDFTDINYVSILKRKGS